MVDTFKVDDLLSAEEWESHNERPSHGSSPQAWVAWYQRILSAGELRGHNEGYLQAADEIATWLENRPGNSPEWLAAAAEIRKRYR
jgi:hypothetical protein